MSAPSDTRSSSAKKRSSRPSASKSKGKGAHNTKSVTEQVDAPIQDSLPLEKEASAPVEPESTQTEMLETLHYGLIKKWATPLNWRKGVQGYLDGHILDLQLNEKGVLAHIKGSYKDHYTTQLIFSETGVSVDCNCPVETQWCKHAVSAAMATVNERFWEQFWGLPTVFEEEELLQLPEGDFQFHLDVFRQQQRALGLRIIQRDNLEPVRQPETVLKQVIASGVKPTDLQKKELGVLQALLKLGFKQTHERQGWFHIPLKQADPLLQLLTQVEEVCDPDGYRIVVEDTPFLLNLSVLSGGASTAPPVKQKGKKTVKGAPQPGQTGVTFGLHWRNPVIDEFLPLEDVYRLHAEMTWGFHRNRLYKLQTPIARLPRNLTKTSFTDVKDAEAAKFIFEELPKIRSIIDVDEAEVMKQLNLVSGQPRNMVNVELVDPVAIRLRVMLNYYYDDLKVPYSKPTPDKPYIMVQHKKRKTQHLVKRDFRSEVEAFQTLQSRGLVYMQANHLQADDDAAVDFYNAGLSELLKEGWTINRINEKDMKVLKKSNERLRIKARIEFDDESVEFFTLGITCVAGRKELDMGEVQNQLVQGKKYCYVDEVGFVEIPLASLLQFNRTLQAFDAENIGPDEYKIQTYKAGLIAELEDQGVKFSMSRKFKKFWDVLSAGKQMDELDNYDNVQAELRPYQERGVNWLWFLYSYGLNGILADDMGLGKTLQALALLQLAKEKSGTMPSLIVCPTSVVYNWRNEIQKFVPGLKTAILSGSDRYDVYPEIKQHDVIITSYAILRRDINALKDYPFRYVILDESQHIKNYDSLTAKAAKQLDSQHRLALSGTPIENRLSELWSVFDFLMPGFLEEVHDFRRRFILPIEEQKNEDAERRLKKQVFPFLLRRMKRDVLDDLPPKLEYTQYCELSDAQYDLYMRILEKTREEIEEEAIQKGGKPSHNTIFRALVRLRQICNHPQMLDPELSNGVTDSGKFEALKEMLLSAMANGHRILVFSQFVEMLKIIRAWLKKEGIKHEILTGQSKNRQEMVDRFNNDESIPIFLVSLKAGGTGLNLTGADFVVHYDPWWNPAAEDQATDRVHRIGQKKKVFVYRFITKGTVEEKIMRLKDRKRDLVDSIIAADRSMGKKMSLDELRDILSPDF